ncbi:enoyl-CoA hydratase/isomerase family protein [Phaeobacter sp. B1627]|uniref:enoyl-CoA hydratase/isomerase family protein n=1 Tax=Phaeobacter sp. B1627 TaxID=2583809 RepID=UPI00111B3C86|nr:enoyl-CoA hydratase/isomerase family protein [Phaeobacter sp. B1627]TNJ46890.1 enoyl-CoA hydratase/isomerase family protein [Phaeobacter sp. B1627]
MERDEWLNRRLHGDGVTELQLGHAPDNRLSAEFLNDFEREIRQMSEDPEVRSILLTSPFMDFSVGLDPEISDPAAMESPLNSAFLALYACPKPVVIATVGRCSGAGMFFVLASDLRVSHSRASFEMIEVQQGHGYPMALMEIARAVLDTNTQRRLMLTGQRLGPIAARNAQFIEIIADDLQDLHGYALKEARKLAALPSNTYSQIKRSLRADCIARIETGLDDGLAPAATDRSRLAG